MIRDLFRQVFFRKRKHKRYHTCERAYVVVYPYKKNEEKFQIIDISEGGCGFIYTGNKEDLIEAGRLSFTEKENVDAVDLYEVNDVKFETANDIKMDESARRRGIELQWLGELEKKGFIAFMENVALCEK
jgi:c-di-GMP-binding flagellar brake protein YcgR